MRATHDRPAATAKIACFAAEHDLRSVAAGTREKAVSLVLDFVAVTLAAIDDEVAEVLDHLPPAPGPATRIGRPGLVSERDAAFWNGTLAHCLEYDDSTLNPVGHPSVVILPGILALAESGQRPGRDLIDAYLIGLEVHARLGQVESGGWTSSGGWFPIGHIALVAAAVACGRLLGLDAGRMSNAIGLAAQFSGGLAANAGTAAKPLGAGQAAASGVLAARLADAGATASGRILQQPTAFFDRFLSAPHDFAPLDRLGDPMHLDETGIAIKRYPSCYATHWGIDALLDLLAENRLQAGDIRTIRLVHPPAGAFCDNPAPSTSEQARFSHEYNLAAAVLDGIPRPESFRPERMRRSDIRALLSRISTANHSEGTPTPEAWSYRVEIETTGGQRLQHAVPRPLGHPRRPMSPEDLDRKLQICTDRRLTRREQDELIAAVRGLDAAPDLHRLMKAIGRGKIGRATLASEVIG